MKNTQRKLRDSESNRMLITSSRRTKKLYQFFAVIIATAFISSAVTLTISADGPTGFGTVIEPGSMVQGVSYVTSIEYGVYYAKNGTTGSIDHSSTDALAFLNTVVDLSPCNGIISLGPGEYAYGWAASETFLIDKPGLRFIGAASQLSSIIAIEPSPTILGGNVSIVVEDVHMETLNIQGSLNLTTNAAVTSAAHYLRFTDVVVRDGVHFSAKSGAGASYVPLIIEFSGGEISKESAEWYGPGPAIGFDGGSNGAIDHVLFDHVQIFSNYDDGDLISMTGPIDNVVWRNCFFFINLAGQTMLNLTPPTSGDVYMRAIEFYCPYIEINVDDVTIVAVADELSAAVMSITFRGGYIWGGSHDPIIIHDYSTYGSYSTGQRILFDGTTFESFTHLYLWADSRGSDSDDTRPTVLPVFAHCLFKDTIFSGNVSIVQLGTLESVGRFIDNTNFNPVGIIAKPFGYHPDANPAQRSITITEPTGSAVRSAGPSAVPYIACDVNYLITSTGGTVTDITIWDVDGNIVLSGVTTLLRQYLPCGYSIEWTFSVEPTVVVEGL